MYSLNCKDALELYNERRGIHKYTTLRWTSRYPYNWDIQMNFVYGEKVNNLVRGPSDILPTGYNSH